MCQTLGASGDELAGARTAERRLDRELNALRALGLGIRDWRQLPPAEIAKRCRLAPKGPPEQRALLATAIFAGTAQACYRGSYWAPSYGCPGAEEVSCRHLQHGSRLYSAGVVPQPEHPAPDRRGAAKITCHAHCHPLDACMGAFLSGGPERRRVALVRCTSATDATSESPRYRHLHEDQLFLRTTYFQAVERMAVDVGEPAGAAILRGGIAYTPAVGILRGRVEDGAPWAKEPALVDVLWAGLQPRPRRAEQGQYACEEDRAQVARTIDRIFGWAAANRVEVLVLPPLGCGIHGCQHPALDLAHLLSEAIDRYGHCFSEVGLASDCPAHFESGWWEAFVDAVKGGRPPILHRVPVSLPPFPNPRKDAATLAAKLERLRCRERFKRETFL